MSRATRVLPAAAIAALAALPLVLEGTYYTFMLVIIFVYVIVSVGLNVLSGYTGQFSLGHAGLFAVGAYTSALVSTGLGDVAPLAQSGLHVWLGVVAAVVMASAFGAILAYPALRVRGPYLAMVTVAFGWVIWKILLEWVSVTGGELGITSIPKARLGSFALTTPRFYYVALALAAAAVLVQRNLVVSPFGRKMQAVKHNELAAASVGVNVYRVKVIVFVLSAGFAGVGGALFAHQQNYINPDNFKFFDSVFFLLAVLFGGAGTLFGPVIGAAVLTLLPELLHGFDHYRLIIYALLILITLYLLPRGIWGAAFAARPVRSQPRPAGGPTERAAPRLLPIRAVTSGQPVLEARSISKSFGGVRALEGVSVAIEPGTVHAVIGPNGAGKTSLLNVLSGVYRPDAGQVLFRGQVVRAQSLDGAARLGIARTFQNVRLFGEMTAMDHVLVGFERHYRTGVWGAMLRTRASRREASDRVAYAKDLLGFVGLAGLEEAPASALAYGHRRRKEIAPAQAKEPEVLLLDEPAAGLIAEEIEALDRLIADLRARGMTVVLVEHHMDLVMSISDRVTVLDHGLVIGEGTCAEVQHDPRVIQAYLGSSDHAVR